ncbi:MAG: nitroimidazol reductase NimA-like FMN-containing flavoprotein [Paracoccaceae bacterium]|jgi:nitroimidazol reductase NimA-like FMN-containing flavoprotein (pyridoxamine 5'-phosphate oxidase superfamily)
MNGAERREFVRTHRTCVFGYPRKAHGPSMSCVYYVMDGEDILVSSMLGRAKPKAVARDDRVSLCVLDENWPPTYITVYGNAVVEEVGGDDLLIAICELMAEQPMPEDEREKLRNLAIEEQRCVIRIKPESTFETPPRHVYEPGDVDTLMHTLGATLRWASD